MQSKKFSKKCLKLTLGLLWFYFLRFVISPQNSGYLLNQSDVEVKTIVTFSFAFSAFQNACLHFESSLVGNDIGLYIDGSL